MQCPGRPCVLRAQPGARRSQHRTRKVPSSSGLKKDAASAEMPSVFASLSSHSRTSGRQSYQKGTTPDALRRGPWRRGAFAKENRFSDRPSPCSAVLAGACPGSCSCCHCAAGIEGLVQLSLLSFACELLARALSKIGSGVAAKREAVGVPSL